MSSQYGPDVEAISLTLMLFEMYGASKRLQGI
jgi:hypothetical protein